MKTPIPPIKGRASRPLGIVFDANHHLWTTIGLEVGFPGALAEILMNDRVKMFPLTTEPNYLALGSDHNFWITTSLGIVSRVTPQGVETDYNIPQSTYRYFDIVSGSDGALWFTECSVDASTGGIGRIDTSGNYTFYQSVCPGSLTNGPDGNIWFSDTGQNVYSMNTQGQIVATYNVGDPGINLISGSDGALYATAGTPSSTELIRVTTSGVVTHFGTDSNGDILHQLVSGPDGNLWILGRAHPGFFLITFNVASQTFDMRIPTPPDQELLTMASGPDGNIWAGDWDSNSIDTYVRLLMTATPKKLDEGVGQNANVGITEQNYAGQWTAVSKNPSIASVTPNSINGTFTITGVALGTTFIAIYDSNYNSVEVKVTVQ
jgi:streptogramin lyase